MKTQLNFQSIAFAATIDEDEPVAFVSLVIDGKEQGELQISRTGVHGQWAIDGIKIDPAFRGMGFYSQLLMNALNMVAGCDSLLSNQRNDSSNPAYIHWTGQQLEESDEVVVSMNGDNLCFSVVA